MLPGSGGHPFTAISQAKRTYYSRNPVSYTHLGEGAANKFDLYVPADKSQDAYGLVVYLHAGGFTGGDKAEDAEMLEWLCSKGYVAAGINYTLFTEENPDASVYSQRCV